MIKNLHWIVKKMMKITYVETMLAWKLINGRKEVDTKQGK